QLLAAGVLLVLGAMGEWIHLRLLHHSLVPWMPGVATLLGRALVVVEALAGVALCEGLGLTVLLGGVLPRGRRTVVSAALLLLLSVGLELALTLFGGQPLASAGLSEATGIRAATGGLLALALAWLPIPLETLTHSLRTVSGALLVGLVSVAARIPDQVARLLRQAALAVLLLYDALILPVLLLGVVRLWWRARRAPGSHARGRHAIMP
ncbi:MAG TPA: hypothetical protein VFN52_00645, partial [Acidiferrobacteraceae bacterium]|nr:hypothetical protein [Acidiferrobacteraceae bacterium]